MNKYLRLDVLRFTNEFTSYELRFFLKTTTVTTPACWKAGGLRAMANSE
jgi:hypothetical protein